MDIDMDVHKEVWLKWQHIRNKL